MLFPGLRYDKLYLHHFVTIWLRYDTVNALQLRHNKRDGVSNHRRLDCLLDCWLNHLFRRRSKKPSKLQVINEFGIEWSKYIHVELQHVAAHQCIGIHGGLAKTKPEQSAKCAICFWT